MFGWQSWKDRVLAEAHAEREDLIVERDSLLKTLDAQAAKIERMQTRLRSIGSLVCDDILDGTDD